MQYKVPQNIDMQDKIIGPLTLIQFIYLMAGGMLTYVLLNTLPVKIFVLTGLPVAILSLALAFLKIQDQPFSKFLLSLAFYIVRPKERFWHKDPQQEKFTSEMETKEKKTKNQEVADKPVEKSQLEQLAQKLDVSSWQAIEAENGQKTPSAKSAAPKAAEKAEKVKEKKEEVIDIFSQEKK